MYEDGFNDCVQFMGFGNPIDPVKHSIDNFRTLELERLRKDASAPNVPPEENPKAVGTSTPSEPGGQLAKDPSADLVTK